MTCRFKGSKETGEVEGEGKGEGKAKGKARGREEGKEEGEGRGEEIDIAEAKAYRIVTNHVDENILSQLDVGANVRDIWRQLIRTFGTINYLTKLNSVTTENERNLNSYIKEKCRLISEYLDKGAHVTDATRAALINKRGDNHFYPLKKCYVTQKPKRNISKFFI